MDAKVFEVTLTTPALTAPVRAVDANGQALTPEAVMQHLQSRIARFKLPRRVVFMDSLPKSALGKVLKPQLQKLLTNP